MPFYLTPVELYSASYNSRHSILRFYKNDRPFPWSKRSKALAITYTFSIRVRIRVRFNFFSKILYYSTSIIDRPHTTAPEPPSASGREHP